MSRDVSQRSRRASPRERRVLRCLGWVLLAVALALRMPGALAEEAHDHGPHTEGEARAFSVEELEDAGVRLATAGPGEVDVTVELAAEVRPNGDRTAHVAPRFPGIVREVRKGLGDRVRAGEVLAVVEGESLSSFTIQAAFDGTVIDRHVVPGEAVSRERAAFIVADLTTVWVDIGVHQKALSQVRVGDRVRIEAGWGSAAAEGAVSYLTPVVDQATRTATARVVLANPEGAWRPGLFATATVFDPMPVAVAVSRRALHSWEGRTVVFVAQGERFEPRPVTVGRVGRTRAEISAGLVAGERYADERSFLVKAELGKGEAGHEH